MLQTTSITVQVYTTPDACGSPYPIRVRFQIRVRIGWYSTWWTTRDRLHILGAIRVRFQIRVRIFAFG